MKLNHFLLVINTLFITSITEAATDYNGPITGPKSFQNNDTVTSTTDYGISDTTTNGDGIQVDGGIKVNVTNLATSPITNGINLANGVTNDLGSSIIEANTTSQATGKIITLGLMGLMFQEQKPYSTLMVYRSQAKVLTM